MKNSTNALAILAIAFIAFLGYNAYKRRKETAEYKAVAEGSPAAAKVSKKKYIKLKTAKEVASTAMAAIQAVGASSLSSQARRDIIEALIGLQKESLLAVYEVASRKLLEGGPDDLINALKKHELATTPEFARTAKTLTKLVSQPLTQSPINSVVAWFTKLLPSTQKTA